MPAWWDSVDSVSWWGQFSQWLGGAAGLLAALAAVAAIVLSNRLGQLQERARAEEKLAAEAQVVSLRDQAVRANQLADALERRQQPRVLPSEFIERLVAVLSAGPANRRVSIGSTPDNPEAWNLSHQLAATFKRAGYDTGEVCQIHAAEPLVGLVVRSRDSEDGPIKRAAVTLLEHFLLSVEFHPLKKGSNCDWEFLVGNKS